MGGFWKSGPGLGGRCGIIILRDTTILESKQEAKMQLAEDSRALSEFRRCVRSGFSIRKIRVELDSLGLPLVEFSDVDLIKLWRKCAQELKEER